MKILFVSASLGMGGSEKCMVEMIRHIDLDKYEVTVLALMPVENMHVLDERIRIINGIRKYEQLHLPVSQYVPQALKKADLKKAFLKCIYWLRVKTGKNHIAQYFWECLGKEVPAVEEDFDVVVGYGQGLATYYAVDKVKNAKRLILWVNTDLEKANYNISYLERFYKRADVIVADSKNGEKNLKRLYPHLKEKCCCFPNMLDIRGILQKAREGQSGYEGSTPHILTVGRLVEAKALHFVVDAASILKQQGIRFCWYIVGEGSLRQSIEAQIEREKVEDCVRLVGMKSNPYPWFLDCDVYVQTSIYEGSCMTINEALAFNKPVVTTNFPAAYEKIKDGKNGFICDMDAQDIAQKVAALIADDKLRQDIAKNIKVDQLKQSSQIEDFYRLLNDEEFEKDIFV